MERAISFLFDLLVAVFGALFEGINTLVNHLLNPPRKVEYDADFLPTSEASKLLSPRHHGFCLDGSDASLSVSNSYKNCLAIGGTGTKKSAGILLPSIFRMRGHASLVIVDVSGELLQKSSGALLHENSVDEIKVVNFNDPMMSEGYNPLPHLKNDSDIDKLSKLWVSNRMGSQPKDPFWNLCSESLIAICLRYILRYTKPQFHTLRNVYHLLTTLSYDPARIDRLIAKSGDQQILAEYKALIASSPNTLSGIIASARAALSLFADADIAAITSFNTLNFSEFRKRRIALYITTGVSQMRYFAPLTSLLLQQFFQELMSHLPEDNEQSVFFLIDEASSLYFPDIQIVISNIRKYHSGLLSIYQSAAQIIDLYGPSAARAISENCFAKVYMGGSQPSISVCQELELLMGKYEYEDENGIRRVRPLMSASDIHQCKDSLIFLGANRVIRRPTKGFFESSKLRKLSELPPYVPSNKLPFTDPPILDLNSL